MDHRTQAWRPLISEENSEGPQGASFSCHSRRTEREKGRQGTKTMATSHLCQPGAQHSTVRHVSPSTKLNSTQTVPFLSKRKILWNIWDTKEEMMNVFMSPSSCLRRYQPIIVEVLFFHLKFNLRFSPEPTSEVFFYTFTPHKSTPKYFICFSPHVQFLLILTRLILCVFNYCVFHKLLSLAELYCVVLSWIYLTQGYCQLHSAPLRETLP